MQEIYVEEIGNIITNKRKLQRELDIKITNKGKNVFVDGEAEKEYLTIKVLEAINAGFSVERALLLKKENMLLNLINIKDITKRNDLERVRARIIGTQGKTLTTLNKLTNCPIAINHNQIGIIGDYEEIEEAIQAVKSLVQGSKQGNVYSRLEKERKDKKIKDMLHLNNNFKKSI